MEDIGKIRTKMTLRVFSTVCPNWIAKKIKTNLQRFPKNSGPDPQFWDPILQIAIPAPSAGGYIYIYMNISLTPIAEWRVPCICLVRMCARSAVLIDISSVLYLLYVHIEVRTWGRDVAGGLLRASTE